MESDLLLQLSQFGAAGLIGLLWVLERRHAAVRDRQLDEAHRAVMQHQREADTLIDVVRENTRAITSLRAGQERLIDLLHLIVQLDRSGAPSREVVRNESQRREHAGCMGAD